MIEDTLDPEDLCGKIRATPPQPTLAAHVAVLIKLLQEEIGAVNAVTSALHIAHGSASPAHSGHDKLAHRRRAWR